MRRLIRILFTILAIIITSYLFSKIIHEQQEKNHIISRIKNLPSVSFTSLKGDSINLLHLSTNHPLVIIYFSPECDYCEEEATLIRKNITQFNGIIICMVSPFPAQDIAQFANHYQLANQPDVYFFLDQKEKFYKTFGVQNFPTLFIYNQQHQLVKQFTGETKIENIIRALRAK